jgi:hypothetical protein
MRMGFVAGMPLKKYSPGDTEKGAVVPSSVYLSAVNATATMASRLPGPPLLKHAAGGEKGGAGADGGDGIAGGGCDGGAYTQKQRCSASAQKVAAGAAFLLK